MDGNSVGENQIKEYITLGMTMPYFVKFYFTAVCASVCRMCLCTGVYIKGILTSGSESKQLLEQIT